MYQLFFDGYPLYDPRSESLQIRDPDVHLAVGDPGSMSFTIDPDHPYAGAVTKLKGQIRLLDDGVPIWRGRVIKDTRDFYLSKDIEAEGLLACLNDSIIPPFTFPDDFSDDSGYQAAAESGNVVQFFLSWLIAQHNSQVGESQKVNLGSVTVTDPNNYIARSSTGYSTTLSIINDKLVDILGGYIVPDYSDAVPTLNYYADLPLTNTQTVEYGGNLLDLLSESDASDTYTAILPVGAEGLTIEELSDGAINDDLVKDGRIIYSQSQETAIGSRITRMIEWRDVTVADNLKTKAIAELTGAGVKHKQTITVKAADLGTGSASSRSPRGTAVVGIGVAGEAVVGLEDSGDTGSASHFRVGRYVKLQSSPHGYSALFPLLELDPDLFDPGNTQITLNATVLSSTDLANKHNSTTQEVLDGQRLELNKKEVHIIESVSTQITEAVQTSEEIVLSAVSENYVKNSDFTEYKESASAELSVLSDEVNIELTKTSERIEEVNGDLQSKYDSITKHFRFTDEGLLIGESGNAVLLRLDNNIVQFLRDNVPQLFLDEHGLNADEIRVKTIIIGNLAIQNEDDGRVSVRKAVTA